MQQKEPISFVRLFACINLISTWRIFMKFDTEDFYESWQKNLNFDEIWYLALYMKTKVRFIVAGDNNSSETISL